MSYIKVGIKDDGGPTENTVLELLRHYDFEVYAPEGQDQMEAYEHLKRGKCMCCGKKLMEDENTTVLITEVGIVGIWCEGMCLQDLQSLGLMREIEEHVLARIDRRADEV